MCEFVSWVEKRGKIKFLTGEQIFSDKGQRKLKEWGVSHNDYCGHGTIRRWYGIDSGDGVDKERTDFSSPSNFPSVIAQAIRDGKMKGIGTAKGLLQGKVYAKWQPELDAVNAKFWDLFAVPKNREPKWKMELEEE